MEIRSFPDTGGRRDSFRQAVLVIGTLAGALLLGIGVITVGGGSSTTVLGVGVALIVLFAATVALTLDIPIEGFLQAAFLASFFFKNDITLLKIDEIEDPSGLNLSGTLVIGLVLLAWDLINDDTEREPVFPVSFTLLLIGLSVCGIASVLYAGNLVLGGFSALSLLTSILITYVTASHFGRPERINYLITGIGAGLVFTGLAALAQFAVGWPLNLPTLGTGTEEEQAGTQSVELSRVPAFLRTPTGMAWVVSTWVPMAIAPLLTRVKAFPGWQKLVLMSGASAGIVAIIVSLARGSWLALVCSLLLLMAFGWIRLPAKERKSYFVSVGAVLVLMAALLAPFSDRIYERLTGDDEGAAMIRIPLMENAINMIKDNALVGVGLNNYRATMTKYDETGVFVSQIFPNPVHNVFMHVTAEIGVPGGIIFCLLLLVAFSESIRAMLTKDRLLFALGLAGAVSIIAFSISGVKEMGSLGSTRGPMRTCFLLLGTIMAVSRVRRQLAADIYSVRGKDA